MRRLPSVQTLRAFEAAARHHSYSAAAEELGVTHGAISHRIRSLESQLGQTLFQRAGREMVPTKIAIALLIQVSEALQILARAVPDRAGDGDQRLAIGIHHSLAICWLIPRIHEFNRQYPDINVEIHSSADLGEFITQNVDVAIRYGTGNWANVSCERIVGETLFPVCSPDYRDRHDLQSPADLSRCTLLRHSWQTWVPWFRAAGLRHAEPNTGLLMSDSCMLIEAAVAGYGVALARSVFALKELEAGRLVALFDTPFPDAYAYYFLWKTGSKLKPVAEQFRSWLRTELADPANNPYR